MSRSPWFVLLLAASAGTPAMTPTPAADKAACEVWQRELAFARTVQQHDADAFASHLAPDAVFDANTGKPKDGADLIRRHWAAIIAGKTVRLDRYPQQVVATSDGALAYSSGTSVRRCRAEREAALCDRQIRYDMGRGSDGLWRVVFDGGDEGKPASPADAAAFHAGRQIRCPMVAAARLPTLRH